MPARDRKLRPVRGVVAAFIALLLLTVDGRTLGSQIPNIIFQAGDARTATTLQYATLCASVAVQNIGHPNVKVNCWLLNKFDFNLLQQLRTPQPDVFHVIKTHAQLGKSEWEILGKLVADWAQDPNVIAPWLFRTYDHTKPFSKDMTAMSELGLVKVLDVSTQDVGAHGFEVNKSAYSDLFGLDVAQTSIVYDWLEVWDQLRICCGMQMSMVWRKFLVNINHPSDKEWAATKFTSAESPVAYCSRLNLTAMETALMQTTLYKAMHFRVPMVGKMSNVDPGVTGAYCRQCMHNTQRFRLFFNEPCHHPESYYCNTTATRRRWRKACNATTTNL